MAVTSFDLTDDMRRRIRYACAAYGCTAAEYIRRAVAVTLTADAASIPWLGQALADLDATAEPAESDKVPA